MRLSTGARLASKTRWNCARLNEHWLRDTATLTSRSVHTSRRGEASGGRPHAQNLKCACLGPRGPPHALDTGEPKQTRCSVHLPFLRTRSEICTWRLASMDLICIGAPAGPDVPWQLAEEEQKVAGYANAAPGRAGAAGEHKPYNVVPVHFIFCLLPLLPPPTLQLPVPLAQEPRFVRVPKVQATTSGRLGGSPNVF